MSTAFVASGNHVTTPTDHSGIALTIAALAVTLAVLCWFIRVFIRFGSRDNFKSDDIICSIGTVVGVVQTVVACTAISHGFGKSADCLEQQDIPKIEKLLYATNILYILTNGLAKCCAILLIDRIFRVRRHLSFCHAIVALTGVWMFAAILAEAIQCDTSHPWLVFEKQCSGLFLRWQAITAFNVIIEVVLFGLSIWHIWSLQMRLQSKFVVGLAFSFRLPVIAAALVRLHYLASINSADPFLSGTPAFIWTQIEMHYSLIACTITCLKSFIARFNTGWGNTHVQTIGDYAMPTTDGKNSVVTTTITSSKGFNTSPSVKGRLRANVSQLTSSLGRDRPTSLGSHSSQQNIIHKTVAWEVTQEQGQEGERVGEQQHWNTTWDSR